MLCAHESRVEKLLPRLAYLQAKAHLKVAEVQFINSPIDGTRFLDHPRFQRAMRLLDENDAFFRSYGITADNISERVTPFNSVPVQFGMDKIMDRLDTASDDIYGVIYEDLQ